MLSNPILRDSETSGQKNVTTAGTAVPLSTTSIPNYNGCIIRAKNANTGLIYVGNSSVSSTNGEELPSGKATITYVGDLKDLYINSSVNGEGVSYRLM